MAENQKKILEMLSEKKITVEEAEKLLSLTRSEEGKGDTPVDNATEKKRQAKYLRVVIQPGSGSDSGTGGERVNIRIPMNLIRAGMKLASLIPTQAADKVNESLKEKGVNFDPRNLKPGDIEEFIQALSDLDVDVQENEKGEHVRVFTSTE